MTASPRLAEKPRAGTVPPPLDATTVRVLHGAVRASLRLRAGRDPDWTWPEHSESEFLRGVRGHHLSGLISPHSADLGLPTSLREGIALQADRVGLKSLAHAGFLRQVHDRLTAAGIPALFFKGLAMEAQTGRQLGERGGGDIDVWVSPNDLEAAIDALGPEWTIPDRYPQPGPTWAWRHWLRWGSELPLIGPVTVDLHWHLHCVRDRLPDFAQAWAVRDEVVIGGRVVPTLHRGHALAHACRHAETDRWRILRGLVDIHLLLAQAAGPVDSTPALSGRTIAVVERSIGLPRGRTATRLSPRRWATLDEQRYLGNHGDRIGQLSRPSYLARVLGRLSWGSRHPVHDALGLLWFLAVAPPHESGRITTTSSIRGVWQGVSRRIQYERARAAPLREQRRNQTPRHPGGMHRTKPGGTGPSTSSAAFGPFSSWCRGLNASADHSA